MIEDTDIIPYLIEIGLSEREAKVYKVLLGISEITAAAIPKFTDVPRTKVYEVLDSLIKKGFCKEPSITSNGQNGGQTYCAVDPKIALKGWLEEKEDQMAELRRVNDQLISATSKLYSLSAWRLKDYDFIEILRGRQEIKHRYTELRGNETTTIREFTKGAYAMSEEEIDIEADLNQKLIEAGVDIKVIYEFKQFSEWNNPSWHQKNSAAGVQTRIIENLPMKMSLFGNSVIMILLSDPMISEPNMTAVIIKHPELYNVLRGVFDALWEQATDANQIEI